VRTLRAALALLALVLAGCAGTSTMTSTSTSEGPHAHWDQVPFDQMPDAAGHNHGDPSQHHFLWRYNVTQHDAILGNAADASGLHAIDLQGGYLFGAVYGSHPAMVDGGVQIWDVHTDPAHPKELGRWVIPGDVGGDRSIGATPDGDFVVIGLEPVDCVGHVNPSGAATSAYLIDARNKMAPVVADVVTPGGSAGSPGQNTQHISTHSVFVHRIQGVDYAFIFGDVYRIDRSETAGARLVYASSISTGHDIYVRDTPWNRTWALSSNGPGGLQVWDVTDPTKPFEIGTWDREDHQKVGYYFHTADVAFVGNQTIIVQTSEDFVSSAASGPGAETGDGIASPFWVVDGNPLRGLTSPPPNATALTELGEWHNPFNHTAKNIRFSLHNPRFSDNGILTIASYHAGFWQLDLRQPAYWAHPALIASGSYADGTPPAAVDPVENTVATQLCGLGITVDTPEYFDVAVGPNGTLYFADVFGGLYTMTPTADHPVFGHTPGASVAAKEE